MALSAKQEAFCIEYSISGKVVESAIKAGFTKASAHAYGSRLLKRDDIQKRLAELAKEYKTSKIADAQEMQEKLTAIIRQEASEEIIMQVFQGKYTEVVHESKKASLQNVLQAIQLLGKMQGAFNEKVTLDILPVVIRDDMRDDD